MSKRMFELIEGRSIKFWEVWRDGAALYLRSGKSGTTGQTRVKQQASAAAAEATLARLIEDKTRAGYLEKRAPGAAITRPIPLDRKLLDRHLANLGEDDGAYLVLADWLQSQADPWGELIALQHAAAATADDAKRARLDKATAKLLKQHAGTILGPVAHHPASHFTWRHGFVREATLGMAADPKQVLAITKAFVARPAARRIEGLALSPLPDTFETEYLWNGNWRDNVVRPWPELAALARVLPAHLTQLGLGGWPASAAAAAYVEMPSFAELGKAFPKLRRLALTGWAPETPSRLALAQLTDLSLRFGNATAVDLEAITSSRLPKLERLSVWFGGTSDCYLDTARMRETYATSVLDKFELYSIDSALDARAVQTFLRALPSTIRHLAVQGATLRDDVYPAIASYNGMKRLKTLDLSGGSLGDDHARALIAAKQQLAHLEAIDVSGNRLTAAGLKKLVAALPNVRSTRQRDASSDDPFLLRYVSSME
jgi:uncharacterized protein (TIGR02996 family)